MSDWGIGIGLKGLYGSQNFAERKKAEQETMQLYTQQVEKDKLAEEAAQLRQQQYDEKISAFSDKLLAPDRDRINKKAGILSMRIREELKMHGGNMGKFLAAGGHTMMEDYKNGVIKSEEASAYLDNKKNSDLILQLQTSGKGHLIAKRDMNAFKSYGEKGEGKITYSGMLNEVKLPDADLYEYGSKIPAKDILEQNRLQIYGNYKMEYPDAPEPSDYDLEVYTDQNYGGKGKEWQRAEAIKHEANRHAEQMAKTQADYLAEIYKANMKGSGRNSKTYKDADGNEIEIDNATGQIVKNPDDKTLKGVGGFTRLQSQEVQRAFGRQPQNITINELYDPKTGELKEFHSEDFKRISKPLSKGFLTAQDQATAENVPLIDIADKGAKKGSLMYKAQGLVYNSFEPVGAREIYGSSTMKLAKTFLGSNVTVDEANKKVTNWAPNDSSYMANGVRVADSDDQVDKEYYKGDYKVKGIVSVMTAANAETGSETIVMNQMDGDKVHKKNKSSQMGKYGNSPIKHKMAMVMENEYGVQFYQLMDADSPSTNNIHTALGVNDDLVDITEDAYNQNNTEKSSLQQKEVAKQETKQYWDAIEGNTQVWQNIPNEVARFSHDNTYSPIRVNLFKTFYSGVARSRGMNSVEDVASFSTNPLTSLSSEISEYDKEGFRFKKGPNTFQSLSEMIKDSTNSDELIVSAIINYSQQKHPEDVAHLQSWLENVKYLNKERVR
jgi:hypothetical protein